MIENPKYSLLDNWDCMDAPYSSKEWTGDIHYPNKIHIYSNIKNSKETKHDKPFITLTNFPHSKKQHIIRWDKVWLKRSATKRIECEDFIVGCLSYRARRMEYSRNSSELHFKASFEDHYIRCIARSFFPEKAMMIGLADSLLIVW